MIDLDGSERKVTDDPNLASPRARPRMVRALCFF